ncbi:MAG: hypothetical protein IJ349_07740 [Clostridia bacterium]|nr:hypothetical protein [Clostridia bacterium]
MITQKEINRYIKDIKKELLYGTKESRQFLKELKQNVTDYAEENQNADMAEVTEQFGKPEDIAATFFEQYGKEDIKKKVNIRRVVVTAVVAVVMMFAIAMITIIIDSHGETHGYIVETMGKETTSIFRLKTVNQPQNTDALN